VALLIYMNPNPYTKPHRSAVQRVAHLRACGLQIARPNVAARKIEEIGYERLRIYFLSRRDHTQPNKPFRPNTTYKDILRLYECDSKLRNICFEGLARFELAFRNRLSEVLSAQFGSHPYFQTAAFNGSKLHNEALYKLIDVFNYSKDQRAKHYRDKYTEPPLPPIWIMKEFLTFGAAARLYASLANTVRADVATHFGIKSHQVFDSWIPGFVDLRNFCAHHDRLFNRNFQKQPQRLKSAQVPKAIPHTLKAQIECLDYALEAARAKGEILNRIENVLNRYPEIQKAEAGF
jgi:abortive infection bacteriophage resistance protein